VAQSPQTVDTATMNLSFHTISNSPDEIAMGHKIWFEPVPGCDVISATANAPGFTPLIAIARHFSWDYDMLERAAAACNEKGEVLIVTSVVPTLILVPATKGRGNTDGVMWDFVKALSATEAQCLHFTHFGFLQSRLPQQEVAVILDYFLSLILPHTLKSITFDIDERRIKQLYGLMRPTLPENENDDF
jgi:hypothetical protein